MTIRDDPMTPVLGRELAQTLGDLAVQMHSLADSTRVVAAICNAAIDLIVGARWAGISLTARRGVSAEVPTDAIAASLDHVQTDLREGPALCAVAKRRTVHAEDLSVETRWPRFTPTAMRLGVRSVLSLDLNAAGKSLGALNLYGAEPGAFTADAVSNGEILAKHAAVALADTVAAEHLQAAVASRDVIGQAKGILMHRDRLTGAQAFAVLTRASQETNIRLADVARMFVADHESTITDGAAEQSSKSPQSSTKRSR